MDTTENEPPVPPVDAAKVEDSGVDMVNENENENDSKERRGQKRHSEGGNETKPHKKRRKIPGPIQPKNAVCQLNELRPGLKYNFASQIGPVHSPVFTVTVDVDGQEYIGRGPSKKLAKQKAAEVALRSFVQFRNVPEAHQAMGGCIIDLDFTADYSEQVPLNSLYDPNKPTESPKNGNSPKRENLSDEDNGMAPSPNWRPPFKIPEPSPQEKNPVMVLNELRPGVEYVMLSETGEAHCKRFTMSVTVEGKTFEGTGQSKRSAKAASAKAALMGIYNMNFSPMSPKEMIRFENGGRLGGVPQVLADHVARLINGKFLALMENQMAHSRRKVLAGIVMTTSNLMDEAKVIALATGTKCINGERISESGNSLNDCHAEIIAKRCLREFLYSNLELLIDAKSKDDSIFIRKPKGGYQLRENVKFHLYISTAPCGDARIFSPHEMNTNEAEDKHPNRRARGQLRTKIESGEGTIPVASTAVGVQTWDGVLQGQRLLTMSCSDKICRWNVVGLQGALLSHFVDPIYLDSIILGSLFHPTHLYRAVYGRVMETIQGLPPPYRLHLPMMNLVSSPEVRQPGKAPNFSVNWTVGGNDPEVINATTGKNDLSIMSRLAKRALFMRFRKLYGVLDKQVFLEDGTNTMQYSSMKQAAKDYQLAKDQLGSAFLKANLGLWMKKPIEQDEFFVTD